MGTLNNCWELHSKPLNRFTLKPKCPTTPTRWYPTVRPFITPSNDFDHLPSTHWSYGYVVTNLRVTTPFAPPHRNWKSLRKSPFPIMPLRFPHENPMKICKNHGRWFLHGKFGRLRKGRQAVGHIAELQLLGGPHGAVWEKDRKSMVEIENDRKWLKNV